MSYLVLARKYRPQNFKEVIGQEHIASLLTKAIETNRIAHAYLFCGPRGIGKTSCARILAKSLNCVNGPTITPCNKCPACQEISNGSSFDVLEIDGASNRGIDEIRALRENIKFAPSYGRYKIYIVDEVHMLTTEAFNALLKTLEEPPPHAKFILATTAPNKVPATIISRCQRFDFKRIPINTMTKALAEISRKEKINIEEGALYAIAKAAQGSLRDGLSILDQLSSLSEQQIHTEDVTGMLGLVETQLLFDLAKTIGEKNCPAALLVLERIADQGKDMKQLLRDLTEHFRHLMVIKIGGKNLGRMVDYPVDLKETLLVQTEQFTLKEILQTIDVLIETQEISRITESLQMPIEIALAKLTFQKETVVLSSVNERSAIVSAQKTPKQPITPSTASGKFTSGHVLKETRGEANLLRSQPQEKTTEDVAVLEEETKYHLPEEGVVLDLEKLKRIWDSFTYSVSREKMSVATYLQEGVPVELKESQLIISFPQSCAFHKEILEQQNNIKLIEKVFLEKFKKNICVKYQLDQDHTPQSEDPNIKAVLDTFKGKVVSRWHND